MKEEEIIELSKKHATQREGTFRNGSKFLEDAYNFETGFKAALNLSSLQPQEEKEEIQIQKNILIRAVKEELTESFGSLHKATPASVLGVVYSALERVPGKVEKEQEPDYVFDLAVSLLEDGELGFIEEATNKFIALPDDVFAHDLREKLKELGYTITKQQ